MNGLEHRSRIENINKVKNWIFENNKILTTVRLIKETREILP